MKNIFIAFVFCAPLMACANPDYVQKKSTVQNQSEQCDVYFEKLTACGKIVWKSNLSTTEDAPFELQIVSAEEPKNLEILKSADLKVVLWMPSMGHGSSPTEVVKKSDMSYDVSRVYFIMNGQWEIRFQFMSRGIVPNQVIDGAVYKVDI